ncbi:hypothetical protein [Ornithinimicrobium tianjinense]|uniref:EspG family protein n=1 Tax=Ornithinimicrobium tianjinense TaxID=1195761 RepID=A0A917BNZ9_9MICO|nr:hypothetical protein [Ornithinimicrobium tianjinense]GGF53567.1 hypothetical protein GCM10011366_21690 [Ornithinimicrobium tianjinense]
MGTEHLLEASRGLTTAGVRVELYDAVETAGEPWEFGSFTDEELHGLDDPTATRPAYPAPWLSGLTDEEREAATSAGLRSLKARQLFDAELVDDAYETWVEPHVAALLTMRRGADAVLVAERTVSGGTDWVVLHAQPRGLWLEEVIDPSGFHHFALVPLHQALTDLAVRLRAGLEPAVGEVALTLARQDLVERSETALAPLADARAVTQLTRIEVGGDGTTTGAGVLVAPGFTVVAEESEGGATISYRSVDEDALRTVLEDLLRPAGGRETGGRDG